MGRAPCPRLRSPGRSRRLSGSRPALVADPARVPAGTRVTLSGNGWPPCPLRLTLEKRSLAGHPVLRGFPHPDGVRPTPDGQFQMRVDLIGLAPGRYRIRAESQRRSARATIDLEVYARPVRLDADGQPKLGPLGRFEDFTERRFGALGYVPAGLRRHQVDGVRRPRPLGPGPAAPDPTHLDPAGGGATPADDVPAHPVPGVCNWTPVGPSPEAGIRPLSPPHSGWALAIALDPDTPTTVYLGTANGGVWKGTDGGDSWTPGSDHEIGLACAAIAVAPADPRRVLARRASPEGVRGATTATGSCDRTTGETPG